MTTRKATSIASLDSSETPNLFLPRADRSASAAASLHIYWSNCGPASSIGHANLDGSGFDAAFINGAHGPCGLAVDSIYIYWGNAGIYPSETTIGRAKLDGTAVNESFVDGAFTPTAVAIEP